MAFFSSHRTPGNVLIQSLCIVLIAGLTGLGINRFRPEPLPLVQDWSAQARLSVDNGESLALDVSGAERYHQDRAAVFIDARDPGQYAQGHIDGALNLPWHQVEEQFMEVAPLLDPEGLIITYCDGETCNLSHDLAFFLREMGFKVKVFTPGWEAWLNAGMPVSGIRQGA